IPAAFSRTTARRFPGEALAADDRERADRPSDVAMRLHALHPGPPREAGLQRRPLAEADLHAQGAAGAQVRRRLQEQAPQDAEAHGAAVEREMRLVRRDFLAEPRYFGAGDVGRVAADERCAAFEPEALERREEVADVELDPPAQPRERGVALGEPARLRRGIGSAHPHAAPAPGGPAG